MKLTRQQTIAAISHKQILGTDKSWVLVSNKDRDFYMHRLTLLTDDPAFNQQVVRTRLRQMTVLRQMEKKNPQMYE